MFSIKYAKKVGFFFDINFIIIDNKFVRLDIISCKINDTHMNLTLELQTKS